ncbi:MAG: hypothetical protein ISS55_11190 [Dehalococcoidales bacterium]|nr:hypothetical protein [Dehalococcoidales bacterium]
MRKLNLRSYQTTQKVLGGDGQPIEVIGNYNVKDSIINVMFLPTLKLQGAELVRQNVLAMKIETCENEVELEEAEYQRVKEAIEAYPAQSRADVELVDRILNQTPEIS